MRPEVSVVIPAYRVTAFIEEAVQSVLRQTFRDFELIVVNDGCPDTEALENVLAPYRGQIVYVRQENRGVSAARNRGISIAKGRCIALLDGDDAWTPDYLETQVGILREDPTLDLVYGNGQFLESGVLSTHTLMDLSPSEGDVTFEALLLERCSVVISVTGRREVFERVGGFDESLRRAEDFDLWLRIARSGARIGYHRKPILHYRRRPQSASADGAAMRAGALSVLDKCERLPLSLPERVALNLTRKRFIREMHYLSGIAALERGERARARIEFVRVARAETTAKNVLRVALCYLTPTLLEGRRRAHSR